MTRPANLLVVIAILGSAMVALIGATRLVQEPPSPKAESFIRDIERAHGAETVRAQQALQADAVVDFGGERLIEGVMTFSTDGGRSRIEMKDGTVMVFDGERAWVSPADSPKVQGARFHLLTWPYFALVPYKLRDGGATLTPAEPMPHNGAPHETAKLTFAPGTGDAPDDWYILYKHPENDRLVAMAYIVTYGKKPGAPEEPHAIVYDEFKTIDGATFSTDWTFYNWSRDKGVHGDPIGKVTLSDLKFVTPDAAAFQKPNNSKEDSLPR